MTGLEVNPKLIADRLEAMALAFFIPRVFVVWDVGVRLPAFKLLVGRAVVHFVVRVSVMALFAGQRLLLFLLLLLLLFLLPLLLLAVHVLGVGLNGDVAVIV